jgi:hypothetical protein
MIPTLIGVGVAVITLIFSMVGVVWRLGGIAARLESETKHIKENYSRVDFSLRAFDGLPAMKNDIEMLKNSVGRMVSEFPKLTTRVAVLEQRAESTDKFRAQTQSSLDREEITRREPRR